MLQRCPLLAYPLRIGSVLVHDDQSWPPDVLVRRHPVPLQQLLWMCLYVLGPHRSILCCLFPEHLFDTVTSALRVLMVGTGLVFF